MKKALLIKIILLSVLAVVLTGVLVFALLKPDKLFENGFINILGINIGNKTAIKYEDSESYSVGNAEIPLNITRLDIEWNEGKVNLIPFEGSKVKIEEQYDGELDRQYNLRYKVENATLTIKPCASGELPYSLNDMFEKELNIYIPYALSEKLTDIKINTSSAYVFINEGIHTETVNITSTSGQITIKDISCDTMQLESVSGHINLSDISARLLNTTNTSGQTKLTAKNVDKLTIESVSGAIIAQAHIAPKSADLESVSGEISLKIPENDGFTLDFDTVSGCISSDFSLGSNDVYKNGEKQYKIETVSSNVRIAKSN